jgi:hypothetical protein
MTSPRDAFRGNGRARVRATRLLFPTHALSSFVGSFACVRCAEKYLAASMITMLMIIQQKLVQNAKYPIYRVFSADS